MKQKAQQQIMKKNLILYKSRTGWKVKTRLFGSLLVAFSAAAVTGLSTPLIGRADTVPPTTQVADSTNATPTGDTPSAQGAQSASSTTDAAGPATPAPATEDNPAAASVPAKTYPVLTPDQTVNVGVDKTQVELKAQEIASHFTAKVENRDTSDRDANPTKNTTTQTIGPDGTVALTSNDAHTYYNAYGGSSTVTGHQSAHVSFEHEIDFSHNFSMSGALGIGSKTSNGADSVGFIFAPGDPAKATQGGSGGNLGIGGLANAFGFVYDEYGNVNDYNDPTDASGIWHPYVGWRTTDANGRLQRAADTDWEAASQVGLNDRQNPLNNFTMDYSAQTQQLTVVLGKGVFTRHIDDVSTGYSLSVAASTGGSWNDYSARIDKFSYTPKTIQLSVSLVDSAEDNAPLNQTTVTADANIGDTISVFSTQAAADRAVAAGEVDPALVTVLPTDTAGNVYVVDGTQHPTSHGTPHTVNGDSTLADGTYYTYTVTDGDGQAVVVPVRLAYQAIVTPVDLAGQPIAGQQPQTVTTVAGEPVIIQVPGYTPTKVVLATPAEGEKVVHTTLSVNQASTDVATTTTTTTDIAQPITHYYQATGLTVDQQPLAFNQMAGTGQPIAGKTVQVTPTGDATASNSYHWAVTGTAAATDTTDQQNAQPVTATLVPDPATLTYWDQQAISNQTRADQYRTDAQNMYSAFSKISGLTAGQQQSADDLLAAVVKIYTDVSQSDQAAQAAFEGALKAPADADIYAGGQTGYAALKIARNLLVEFKADLNQLTTTNKDAQNMLASLPTWTVTYGEPLATHQGDVTLGPGFGDQLTAAQLDDLKACFTYATTQDPQTPVLPSAAGTYKVSLSDAGRAYLKNLAAGQANAGLFVPGLLTITPKAVAATINDATVTYGQLPDLTDQTTLGAPAAGHAFQAAPLEIWDTDNQQVVTTAQDLKVGGHYRLRYTATAQATLKQDKNYDWTSFGTGTLSVQRLSVMVKAQSHGKTYGDDDPLLDLTTDSGTGLAPWDTLASLGVTLQRASGRGVGDYAITIATVENLNYDVKLDPDHPGILRIAPAQVTLTADSLSKVYGEPDPQLTFSCSQPLGYDDQKADLHVTLTRDPATTSENVGDHPITFTQDGTPNPNYQLTPVAGTLTITPRPITVTVANVTKTYGALDPTFSLTQAQLAPGFTSQTDALVGSDTLADLGAEFSRDLKEDANQTYTIRVDRLANANYQLVGDPTGQLTIQPRVINLTIDDAQKVYGAPDPVWTWSVTTPDDTLAPLDPATLGLTVTRVDQRQDVGKYQLTLQGYQNHNYAVRLSRAGQLTITPRPIRVTIQDAKQVYGDADAALTFTTTDQLTAEQRAGLNVTLRRDPGHDVGTYAIHGTTAPGNYAVTFENPTAAWLTITPRPLTVRLAQQTKTYDQPTPDPQVAGSVTGLATGDSLATLGLVLTPVTAEDVGSYPIKGYATNPNYTVNVEDGRLQILPATVRVVTADTAVRYGDVPMLTGQARIAGKLVTLPATDFEIVDEFRHVIAPQSLQVGHTYTLQLTQAAQDRLGSNYLVGMPRASSLVVDPREVTVRVADQHKTVGDRDPQNTATLVTGSLKPGDTLAALHLQYLVPATDDAGTYPIKATSANPNYQVHVLPGQLTVFPQPVSSAERDTTGTIPDEPQVATPVTVTKQWPDRSTTQYTYDPATHQITVIQVPAGQTPIQRVTVPGTTLTIHDQAGHVTVVVTTDPQNPQIRHFQATPKATTPVAQVTPVKRSVTGRRPHGDGQSLTQPAVLHTNGAATQQPSQTPVGSARVAGERATVGTPEQLPASSAAVAQPAADPTTAPTLPQTGQRDERGWSALGLLLLAWLLRPFIRRHSTR